MQAAGYFSRLRNDAATVAPIDQLVDVNDTVDALLYGTGLGGLKDVSATIGGVNAEVAYAGPQGPYAVLDQFNLILPRPVAGKGRVEVVLTVVENRPLAILYQAILGIRRVPLAQQRASASISPAASAGDTATAPHPR